MKDTNTYETIIIDKYSSPLDFSVDLKSDYEWNDEKVQEELHKLNIYYTDGGTPLPLRIISIDTKEPIIQIGTATEYSIWFSDTQVALRYSMIPFLIRDLQDILDEIKNK